LWAYTAVLATIVVTGAYGWWAAQQRPREAGIEAEHRAPPSVAGHRQVDP
jgi:hypothetical protein